MNYIILNGVNSNTITGLLIQELPPISKPLMRTQIDQIDGRDGDIVTKLGYGTVDKELSIGLHGNYDIDAVIEYFASEGTVVFSNEPDKYYRYQVLDQIDFERLVRFRTATVTMHCQPFKYEVNETPIEDAGSTVETGGIVSFETQSADAVGVKVNVEPYQNLNGYDHPWVGGAGKNLWDLNSRILNQTSASGTALTAYTLSGENVSITDAYGDGRRMFSAQVLPTGTYTFSAKIVQTSTNSTITYSVRDMTNLTDIKGATQIEVASGQVGSFTFTLSAETNVAISFQPRNQGTGSIVFTQIQLEQGSTATAWTPYENICPINPANGKNLLPYPYSSGASKTSNGITFTANSDGSVSVKGTATANADYYFVGAYGEYVDAQIPSGNYLQSFSRVGGEVSINVRIYFIENGGSTVYATETTPLSVTVDSTKTYRVFMRVMSGYSVDATYYPMVTPVEIKNLEYVSYNAIGITRTGKNLLSGVKYGTINQTTGQETTGTNTISYMIKVNESTEYTLSGLLLATGAVRFFCYDSDETFLSSEAKSAVGSVITYATPSNTNYMRLQTSSTVIALDTPAQFELGSTATPYEPYQGVRYYSRDYNFWDGQYESGAYDTSTGLPITNNTAIRCINYIPIKPVTSYYASIPSGGSIRVFYYDSTNTFISSEAIIGGGMFTSPNNAYFLHFHFSPATSYTDGSIIINYSNPSQVGYGGVLDVSTGLLTITNICHSFTGGVVLYGNYGDYNAPLYYVAIPDSSIISVYQAGISSSDYKLSSNYFAFITSSSLTGMKDGEIRTNTSSSVTYATRYYFRWDDATDATAINTAFSTNPLQVVAVLETPLVYQLTPTQVQTLLGVNNIWTDSGTVTVSVPNMISVVNEGNTTAKPTMTIYGSGNIGVWLNGMQVFQIALGDTGDITIDSEQMEAYQGGILRNRLVTGDYNNFVLQKGENTISVTGNVTNVEITNYSRWL